MMKVKAIAIRTAGLGCIEGDTHTDNAQMVMDKGTYYEVYVHENRQIRYSKKDWRLEVSEA